MKKGKEKAFQRAHTEIIFQGQITISFWIQEPLKIYIKSNLNDRVKIDADGDV